MKRILLCLLMALTTLVVPSSASSAATPLCITRPALRQQHDFDKEVFGVVIYWKYCWPDGDGNPRHGWARPTKAKFVIVRDNNEHPCGWSDFFQGGRFRLYIWNPMTGVNAHTPAVWVPCASVRTNTVTWSLAFFPRYYYTNSVAPRWKVNMDEVWQFDRDHHATVYANFPHP